MYNNRINAIPCIRSYQYLLNRFNDTAPIRGREVRPLGSRREWSRYRMEKHGDALHCIYHKTAILRVHPTNIYEVNVEGWHTMTTAAVLNAMLPASHVYMRDHKLVVCVRSGEYRVPEGGLRLQMLPSGDLAPIDAEPMYIHKINRKKANAVRKPYQAFLAYVNNVTKIMISPDYDPEDMVIDTCAYLTTITQRRELRMHSRASVLAMMTSGDDEQFYQALLTIMCESNRWVRVRELATRINTFILRSHASQVLERVVLPLGEVRQDKYKDWVY